MQHHSFGLAALNREIIQPGFRILDLGPLAVGSTQAFLQMNCPCHIEDLIEFFVESQHGEDLREALAEHLVAKPSRIKFDVVLCWDLLNFMSTELIAHLVELLQPNLKPGSLLHAMIYTGSAPPGPAKFRLLQDFTYEIAEDPQYPRIACQHHSTAGLTKSLGRFSLSNSLLQRQGMRKDLIEHFFEFDAEASQGKVRPGGASDVSAYFTAAKAGKALTLSGLPTAMGPARRSPVSRVMDCGPRSGRNVDALQRQVGELFVLDLHEAIQWHKRSGSDGSAAIDAAFNKFVRLAQCDVILAWDLIDFYSSAEASLLSELLVSKLKPGGMLHMVFCKRERLAQRPMVFEVQEGEQVLVQEFPRSEKRANFENLTAIIRALPRLQLVAQGHGKLPSGAFYHEFILKKFPEAQ